MNNLKINLFIKEVLLFAGTLALAVFTAARLASGAVEALTSPIRFETRDFLISAIIFGIFIFLLYRYRPAARFSFRVLFYIILFLGIETLLSVLFSSPYDALFALAGLLLYILFANVIIHDLAVMGAIAGIAAIFGVSITPWIAVVILAVMSVYDIIAVYKTKHMVALARGMIESGAVFGFIVPTTSEGFLASKVQAKPGDQFMILGSGDVALPAIMAGSLASISMAGALWVGLWALAGLFVTHFLFTHQPQRRPMAALPPIATFTIFGYLLFLLY